MASQPDRFTAASICGRRGLSRPGGGRRSRADRPQYNLHGGTIGIDHGQGFESMYLHLSKFAVSEGTMVKAGDIIGYAGSTGRSTAPHLHWSLYVTACR